MKKRFVLFVFAAIAAGCGGGGGAGQGTSDDDGSIGPLLFRSSGSVQKPVLTSGKNVVVMGVYGGSITDMRVKLPQMTQLSSAEILTNTMIGFVRQSRSHLYSYGSGEVFDLSPGAASVLSPEAWIDIHPDGTKVVVSEPNGPNYAISTMNIDGSNRKVIASSATFHFAAMKWSPDGSKIVYSRAAAADGMWTIHSMNADGTGKQQLTTAGIDTHASYSPDGTKVAFLRESETGPREVWVMNANGSAEERAVEPSNTNSFDSLEWSPVSNEIVVTYSAAEQITGGKLGVMTLFNEPIELLNHDTHSFRYGTWSPDGTRIAYERNVEGANNLESISAHGIDAGVVVHLTQGVPVIPSWGPYVPDRRFVGPGGIFGSTSGGFLVALQDLSVPSIVNFDSGSRDTIQVSAQDNQNPTQPNVLVTIEGTSVLTSLSYVNNMAAPATKVILPSNTTSHADAAVVAFSATTGRVTAVIPYSSASSGKPNHTGLIRGKILGVWDEDGVNRAPTGASEVQVDPQTGAIVSIK